MHFLAHCAEAIPGTPLTGGVLALIVICFLLAAALIDAIKGKIPDGLIVAGLFITVLVEAFTVGWLFAASHLLIGLLTGVGIYLVNEIWYRFHKHDALGMGDAKWSALAVDCFYLKPVLIAWVLGSLLALFWIGVLRLLGRKLVKVHFAPFLWIGLVLGIYVLRFR